MKKKTLSMAIMLGLLISEILMVTSVTHVSGETGTAHLLSTGSDGNNFYYAVVEMVDDIRRIEIHCSIPGSPIYLDTGELPQELHYRRYPPGPVGLAVSVDHVNAHAHFVYIYDWQHPEISTYDPAHPIESIWGITKNTGNPYLLRGRVGGIQIPIDKLALLAPYIGLASTILIATAATAVYVKRVKHRKEKQ